jgi:flagellin FlaB
MKSNTQTQTNLEEDKFAAIGIGAMIVFIALILVAAVAAAVIIQTAEKLQQNAQSTGEDTADSMNGKLMISQIYSGTTAVTDYEVYARLSPGSDSIASTTIFYQLICPANTLPVEGGGAGANAVVVDEMDQTNVAIGTIAPGTPVMITIPGGLCAPNAAANSNQDVQLYLHVGGGGTTFETMKIPATVNQGTPLI